MCAYVLLRIGAYTYMLTYSYLKFLICNKAIIFCEKIELKQPARHLNRKSESETDVMKVGRLVERGEINKGGARGREHINEGEETLTLSATVARFTSGKLRYSC